MKIKVEQKDQNCLMAAKVFKTLSHPLRLKILCSLFNGEKTVGALEELCHGSQSLVSQCLKRLELENYVGSRRVGKNVYYKIIDERLVEFFQSFERVFCCSKKK